MDKEYELDELRTQAHIYALAMAKEAAVLAGATSDEIVQALRENPHLED